MGGQGAGGMGGYGAGGMGGMGGYGAGGMGGYGAGGMGGMVRERRKKILIYLKLILFKKQFIKIIYKIRFT